MALTKKQIRWWKVAGSIFIFEFLSNIAFVAIVQNNITIDSNFLILSAVVTLGLMFVFKQTGVINKSKC